MLFQDKTALVTGANGGIGRKIVEKLCFEGCHVYAHMRQEKEEFTDFVGGGVRESISGENNLCIF